jgi:hypothetical protein
MTFTTTINDEAVEFYVKNDNLMMHVVSGSFKRDYHEDELNQDEPEVAKALAKARNHFRAEGMLA